MYRCASCGRTYSGTQCPYCSVKHPAVSIGVRKKSDTPPAANVRVRVSGRGDYPESSYPSPPRVDIPPAARAVCDIDAPSPQAVSTPDDDKHYTSNDDFAGIFSSLLGESDTEPADALDDGYPEIPDAHDSEYVETPDVSDNEYTKTPDAHDGDNYIPAPRREGEDTSPPPVCVPTDDADDRTQRDIPTESEDASSPEARKEGIFLQAWNVIRYMLGGNMRRSIHFAISEDGCRSWPVLMLLQLALPLTLGFCLDAYICGKAIFFSDTIARSVLSCSLLWAEHIILLTLHMRLMSAVLGTGLHTRSILSLITAASIPLALTAIFAAVAAALLTPLMLPLILLGFTMFFLLLYMGMEAAAISSKVLGGGWFAIVMLIYFSLMTIFAEQLIII